MASNGHIFSINLLHCITPFIAITYIACFNNITDVVTVFNVKKRNYINVGWLMCLQGGCSLGHLCLAIICLFLFLPEQSSVMPNSWLLFCCAMYLQMEHQCQCALLSLDDGDWVHLCSFIYLFICWISRVESSCFATTLLHHASPKVTSVLVLFAIFRNLF